jgi:uncharacterized alkaline shock family protein YloU
MANADSSVAKIEPRGEIPGRTTLADTVIETIAGIAAREVRGVFKLGGGSLSEAYARVAGTSGTSHGVRAEVGKKEVAVDLDVVVEYGVNLNEVAQGVRHLVTERLAQMTGLGVKEVNVAIVDVHYDTDKPMTRRVE